MANFGRRLLNWMLVELVAVLGVGEPIVRGFGMTETLIVPKRFDNDDDDDDDDADEDDDPTVGDLTQTRLKVGRYDDFEANCEKYLNGGGAFLALTTITCLSRKRADALTYFEGGTAQLLPSG
jgi:hypothetical protein